MDCNFLLLRYGEVFRFDIGHDPTVILCDHGDIVASANTEEMLGKPYDELYPFIDVRGKSCTSTVRRTVMSDNKN